MFMLHVVKKEVAPNFEATFFLCDSSNHEKLSNQPPI